MLAFLFVIVAVAFRFLMAPLAFAPVAASLLFFGARAPRKHAWIPLALLVGADVVLTKITYSYPFTADHFVTWAWYAAVLLLGGVLRNNAKPLRVGAASLAASISFFLVSNFAVWAVWNMYPKNLSGLMLAYAAGLPFFRNQVLSDLFFTAVMFGIGALLAGREQRASATESLSH
ncbi:MAG: DUF6580 family putative transport protein [Terriglobales bacterium]